MKIYYQLNNNDCGISVTQSLIKYFFNKEPTREELYHFSNIKGTGLTILDLEKLNEKYGIHLDSYFMSFQEFRDHATKDYFLLVIKVQENQHFTIAQKTFDSVTLFDSALGKVTFPMDDFEQYWAGVFITITPKTYRTPSKYFPKLWGDVDFRRVFTIFSVNTLVLILSILNTYLLRYSINHTFNNHHFSNLFNVLLFSLIILAIFYWGELLESWLSFRHKTHLLRTLHSDLIKSLKNKKNSYFHKLGKNQFLLLKDHINCIATYHSEHLNKWLSGILTVLVVSIILISYSPYFLFLIILTFLVQLIFWKCSRDIHLQYYPTLNLLQNDGKRLTYKSELFLSQEANISKLNSLSKSINDNWESELDLQETIFWKQTFLLKLNAFLNHLFYFVSFALIAWYIFTGSTTAGHLIVFNILHHHLSKSLAYLIGYYGFKSKYLYSREIYSQFINIDNFPEIQSNHKLPDAIIIKDLSFAIKGKMIFRDFNAHIKPHTIICGPSGSGKTILYRLISQKFTTPLENIYFDQTPISELNPTFVRDSIIYQTSASPIHCKDVGWESFLDSLDPTLQNQILHICSLMNLNLFKGEFTEDNLSSGQKQLINILMLLEHKNKLLLLDEVASHIHVEAKSLVYRDLIGYLSLHNFVVCSEHADEVIPHFANRIDICPIE